jgi:hypothetical protein
MPMPETSLNILIIATSRNRLALGVTAPGIKKDMAVLPPIQSNVYER